MIKHKKSYPYEEEERLSNQKNYFFYIGADNPIKKLLIEGEEYDLDLRICRDDVVKPTDEIKNNPPHFLVIVSASVNLIQNNLFGAINIHMDSSTNLHVSKNDKHPKSHAFSDIKSSCYFFIDANNQIKRKYKSPILVKL